MDAKNTTYRVYQCSECSVDTEYYCELCHFHLCSQCKEDHVKDLKTIDHDVVSHRDKINYIPTQEICVRHHSHVYKKYCELCEIPLCYHCRKHRKHKTLDIRQSYQNKRQQHKGTIHTIRSDALFYRPVLLTRIKTDVKACQTNFTIFQSKMLLKAQRLKYLINYVMNDEFCDFDFKHRCLKQMIEMGRHIVSLQRYVNRYEQRGVIRPLLFLSSLKKALPQIHLTIQTSQLSMTESIKKKDVMASLCGIQITEKGNRCVGNNYLLTLMSSPEFHLPFTLPGVDCCCHITIVTSNRFWVSDDKNNLILSNSAGDTLHHLDGLIRTDVSTKYGSHTVNNEGELIYMNAKFNIDKLSKDMKTITPFIEITDSTWKPQCIYCSNFTGDVLVGMYKKKAKSTWTGMIIRYNQSGKLIHTIPHNKTGKKLYGMPRYITENNNEDVVASVFYSVNDNPVLFFVDDYGAVVVTERGGGHRFSYDGPPSGAGLEPAGICTDALSHILLCDEKTNTVQMLDKDGNYLSHLLIRPEVMFKPYNLSYDANTHRLWVGSQYDNNKVCVYRYVTRQDTINNLKPIPFEEMASPSTTPTAKTRNQQQGNECRLKVISPPELINSFTLPDVYGGCWCLHISCVTPDPVWVSDNENNLILMDKEGNSIYLFDDLCDCNALTGNGSHTVNGESELIFIDTKYNIIKLSKDKTTTTFLERKDFTRTPPCVYCSPFSGDLLVGMYNYDTQAGMVARYNQNGQLKQTVQHDVKGFRQYDIPYYITENNNGDIVVSELNFDFVSGVVVVTDREGRHRFSYTGSSSGSGLQPLGLCTDALSHILVCDGKTDTVQMLDRDGHFLSHLLTGSTCKVYSLSYDFNTHRLWVGKDLDLCVYMYLDHEDPQKAPYSEIANNS